MLMRQIDMGGGCVISVGYEWAMGLAPGMNGMGVACGDPKSPTPPRHCMATCGYLLMNQINMEVAMQSSLGMDGR